MQVPQANTAPPHLTKKRICFVTLVSIKVFSLYAIATKKALTLSPSFKVYSFEPKGVPTVSRSFE